MSGAKPVHVQGPLELADGRWLLRIPLAVGGRELIACTRGISEVRGDILEISVPENLVRNLKLKAGQHLWVNSDGGKFAFEWEPETGSKSENSNWDSTNG